MAETDRSISEQDREAQQREAVDKLYNVGCALEVLADGLDRENGYGLAHVLRHLRRDVSNAASAFDV